MEVLEAESFVVGMRTRLPFRYGIAEMTVVPHVVVRLTVEVEGESAVGLAADHLPPKWFAKDPGTSYEEDVPALVATVLNACDLACRVGPHETPFAFWLAVDAEQRTWGVRVDHPPLLTAFGATLVERAVIDAWCRIRGLAFPAAVQRGALGLDPAVLHPELPPDDGYLRTLKPVTTVTVRHTVGLGDSLTDGDATGSDPHDDLPFSLSDVFRRYGIDHLKIKLCGEPDVDLPRLREIFPLAPPDLTLTLDGNESFHSIGGFREAWARMVGDPMIGPYLERALLVVEQPLHRLVALEPDVAGELAGWDHRPPIVIDESDDSRDSLRRALGLGYSGVTFKSCKGVQKGLANAALIHHRGIPPSTGMTAEDLATVPPISLLQDLSVVATLGLKHVERNGHHYFHGPAPVSDSVSAQLSSSHPDLFTLDSSGRARLIIDDGTLHLGSILRAPFGYACTPALDRMEPLTVDAAVAAITKKA